MLHIFGMATPEFQKCCEVLIICSVRHAFWTQEALKGMAVFAPDTLISLEHPPSARGDHMSWHMRRCMEVFGVHMGTSYFHQGFSHVSSPPNSWFMNAASKMRLESSCFTTAACKSFSSSDWLALEHLNGSELSWMDDSVALTIPTWWPKSLVKLGGFPAQAHINNDRNSWILVQNRRNFI